MRRRRSSGLRASRGRAAGPFHLLYFGDGDLPWEPSGQLPLTMPLTTGEISVQQLMDSAVSPQEIEARITVRIFEALHRLERSPSVQTVQEQLLAVLHATSPDGVI